MALEAALTHGEMSRHFRQHRLLPTPVTEKLLNRCFHSGVNPLMLHQLPALLLTHGCRHRIGLGRAAVQKGLRERGFITAGTIMNRAAQDSGKGPPASGRRTATAIQYGNLHPPAPEPARQPPPYPAPAQTG